jgi:hypothetical protein
VIGHRTTPTSSSCRRALGHTFTVTTPYPVLTRYLDAVFSSLTPCQDAPAHRYELRGPDHDGTWSLHLDDQPVRGRGTAAHAVSLLLWSVNREAIEASEGRLLLHAGGVVLGDVGVVLPGDMEVGKTTLTTALLLGGGAYLSDEAVGFDAATGRLVGYPKALSLDVGSWSLFPELEPEVPPDLRRWLPAQWQVAPGSIREGSVVESASPGLVVLPRYRGGASTVLRRLGGVEALVRLSGCVFDTGLERRHILRQLAALLERAPAYELVHGDLDGAVATVMRLARSGSEAVGTTSAGHAPPVLLHADPPDEREGERTDHGDRLALDPSLVVAPAEHVTRIDVSGDVALHVGSTDELIRLNETAALLWGEFDGERSVAAITADLTPSAPERPEQLLATIAGYVAELLGRGVLVDRRA